MTRIELEKIEDVWHNISTQWKAQIKQGVPPDVAKTYEFITSAVIAKICHEKLELFCMEETNERV